jgi:hypothetical protein
MQLNVLDVTERLTGADVEVWQGARAEKDRQKPGAVAGTLPQLSDREAQLLIHIRALPCGRVLGEACDEERAVFDRPADRSLPSCAWRKLILV